MSRQGSTAFLPPLRVLDLTDEKGMLCGKILGDLGADVIKIERPGGDSTRNIGPFYRGILDPQKSLFWFAYNMNKRGITLDIESVNGQKIFLKLVETADIVLESSPPGYMDWLGLGYLTLSKINLGVIMTSITPFGHTGPYKDYKASDLVVCAMGGMVYLTGDPDRPPVRVSFPQSWFNSAAEAAVGTMLAYYHRELTGEGQHVDVSMQQSLVCTTSNAISRWEMNRDLAKRAGMRRIGFNVKGASPQQAWPCKDGFACFIVLGGTVGARTNRAIVEWMDSEGMANDFLKTVNWEAYDAAAVTPEELEKIEGPISKFFMEHTKMELAEGAAKRGIMLMPVSNPKDIVDDPQLKARDFWLEVKHPELEDTITYPGAFVKSSEILGKIPHRAPLIGEHNEEVYHQELGFSKKKLNIWKRAGII